MEVFLYLTGEPRIAVVRPLCIVVALPELDWSGVGAEEYSGAQERVQGGGESTGHCCLNREQLEN